jgi:hypothetical protein
LDGHASGHSGDFARHNSLNGSANNGQELQAEAAGKHQLTVGAVVSALTAMAKLAGLWVDRAENINGHYAFWRAVKLEGCAPMAQFLLGSNGHLRASLHQ